MNYFKKISLRTIIQFSIVILVVVLSLIHQKLGVEKAAPVDAYCPFGAIESLFTLIFKGEFLKRIFTSSFILMGIFFLATLFLGRVFCGYFCPLGAIQEWLRKLGRLMGIKKDLEILDTKFTHADNKETKDQLLKELTMKWDEGKTISKEIDQTRDNIDYDFTVESKDIVLTTTDGKRISLMDELKLFTKEGGMSIGFFTENTYAYYDNIGHMYPNAYREKLLDREVSDEYVFPEHIIITPSFWNI
jgi:hypothetical protein